MTEIDKEQKNFYTLTYSLPIGATAFQAREWGCAIPSNIPDCAVYKNGIFEWIELKFDLYQNKNKPAEEK